MNSHAITHPLRWVAYSLLISAAGAMPPWSTTQAAGPVEAVTADTVLDVWPASPPDFKPTEELERDTSDEESGKVAGRAVIRLGHVQTPQLHIFRPDTSAASSTAVVICPGGGYSILAWDLEGIEVAQWLQSIGVTAAVLKYRVPTRQESASWLAPAQDIQRSIELLRSNQGTDVKIERVGVLGFSAGGNAAARVATADRKYFGFAEAPSQRAITTREGPAVDPHDAGVRPDFAVLVYPAWLVRDDDASQLIEGVRVDEKTPPMFLVHARNDPVTCLSSVTLFTELQKWDIPAALHVFADGGHGYGLRPVGRAHDQWPQLCEAWMRDRGWLRQ